MSTLRRRVFLSGAMALPATAIVAAAAWASEALASAPLENPKLIELSEQIEPLRSSYRAASERKQIARAMAEQLCPRVPEDLVCKNEDQITFAGCAEDERDVEGNRIYRRFAGKDGSILSGPPRQILKAERIRERIAGNDLPISPRTKLGTRVRAILQLSDKHEAERQAVIDHSEIVKATHEARLAACDIETLAWRIREIEPLTMAGTVVLARALAAFGECESDVYCFEGKSGMVLGRELAQSLLRQTAVCPIL
jgi:hypothetical protein